MKLRPSETEEVQDNTMNGLDSHVQEEETSSIQQSSLPHRAASKESKAVSATAVSSTANSVNPTFCNMATSANNVANCICQSCLERRSIEAEQLRRQLRHAWTQVRHIVYCAYFGPYGFNAIESEEFKSYVVLLVAEDAHLLFCRIESTARDYVNGIKTRLLKQLTNGFNSPGLACSFVDAMFDEYTRLINSAKTVSTYLLQLEEQYMSHFNNATWEMHNMNLFQSMIFNLPAIHRTFAEITQQLRMGSAHCDMKHENKYTVALMRFLRFETKMQELAVQWRDIQKQIDDFHDHRVEIKQRRQKPSHHQDDNAENYDFYKIQELTAKQHLRLLQSKQFSDKADEAKLSLTLRKCFGSNAPSGDNKFVEAQSATADKNDDESDSDPSFESPFQSDGSFNEPCYPPPPEANLDVTSMPLCANYLQNIHPPSVSSGDSDGSSDESPRILERPPLTVPLDLDGDAMNSLTHQQCSNDVESNSLFHLDAQPNILLNSATRSFILPTFHHATSYHTHHLHQLQKQLLNPSEQAVNIPKFRPPSPTVKTKTDSVPNSQQTNSVDNLFVNTNDPPSLEVSEDSLTASPSVVFGSRASDILADLPQMIKSTANRVSNITSLVENLCKDAWSSPSSSSSSSNNVTSSGKEALVNRTRHKHVKLKKKKKLISRPKHKVYSENITTEHNTKHLPDWSPDEEGVPKHASVQVDGNVEKDGDEEESDNEIEEDADDEDDGEDDADDVCKCQKCRQLFKSCRTPSDTNFQFEDFKPHYLPQDVSIDGDGPCKCSHCMQLVTASYLAAQSSKAQSHLANFTPIDLPDANMHSPFYNSMQNIHPPSSFMIHPHLYGLPAMGGTNSMAHPFEQASSVSNQSRDASKSNSSVKEELGSQENRANSSAVFQHFNSSSSAEWNVLGKSANAKFASNSTGQTDETQASVPEWPASSHHAWLNSSGSIPGALSPHLISPAFQHYISNSSIAGQQSFFPLLSGATHLPHPGIHSTAAFFQPSAENDGLYNATSDGTSASSSSLNTSSTSTSSSFSSSSYMASVSSSSSASSSPSSCSSSIFTPTSTYFSPSLYSQIPALSSNNISPFSLGTPISSANSSPLASTTSHNTSAAQAIHFHPGTSVSLKDAHFNMPIHENPNIMFNPSLAHFSSGERPVLTAGPSQNLFSTPTTLSQASCIQHNPFLQPIPISSASHTMDAYVNTQGQKSAVTQVNMSGMAATAPTSTAANTLHIRQQILRRKKLVAHSKLAKQLRPHQHNQKLNDHSASASDGQSHNFQKLHGQSPLSTPPTLSPNQSPQAGSVTSLEPPKQQPPPAAPNPSGRVKVQPSQAQNKETKTQPDKSTSSVAPNQPPTPKQASLSPNTADKEGTQQNANHQHMHPPNYHNVPGNCHDPSGEGAANDPSGAGNNHDNSATTNAGNNAGANSNCKYCNCCYCEFFGNGSPATTSTSKNYNEMRERLLRKLHTKTKKSNANGKTDHAQLQPSVDDLLNFIEGDKSGQDGGGRKPKKSKQKQKKESDKPESALPIIPAEKLPEKEKKMSITSDSCDEKIFSLKQDKNDKDVVKEQTKMDQLSLHDSVPDTETDDKMSRKKKKKKQAKQEEERNTEARFSTKAFLDESTSHLVHSVKKIQVSSQAPMVSVEKHLEKNKSKFEDNKKSDSKTQQERKTKPESKKLLNKQVNDSLNKVEQNVTTSLTGKNLTKKSKETVKVNNSVSIPEQKLNSASNLDRNLTVQAKDKSLDKRPQEQMPDRNHSTVETTQKQKKKNKGQKASVGVEEKSFMNGQDFSSPQHAAATPQSRDRRTTNNIQASSKEKDSPSVSVGSLKDNVNHHDRPTDNDADSKKNRVRKSRRKNARKTQSLDKEEHVDQVFLPRETLEEDAKELDDTEKEVDSFKRFCLHSSALNKQKKITVNWKEFNFKKNH